ncbi:MAG: TetR/AcrR family transcriptional regulator [Firmicutes bacterium]|nr:TetR/AcrR family transcriptional regulator [Bacillota bacterium]
MPPKPKYTKEEIVNAAYELTREKGIDAVVAREVGKRLNTSSSPIFTLWNSMEELKMEVWMLAKQKYQAYMEDIFDYTPAFKEYGMRCVRFAAEEPNLYRMLFLTERENHSPYLRFKEEFGTLYARLVEEIRKSFELSGEDAEELLNQMIIFANGIAAFVITDKRSFSEESVSRHLSQVCIGAVMVRRLRSGSISWDEANGMANYYDMSAIPKKKPLN